jgi:hypothetical protein
MNADGERKAMNQSESIKALSASLVRAQAKFPTIPKTKTVIVHTATKGSYEFKYAPLQEMIAHIRPVLAEHGLGFIQGVDDDRLVTTLIHETGEWKSHAMPLVDMPNPQQYGSVMTYKRRYSLKAILGIETDDDDEGSAAVPEQKTKATPNADPWPDVPQERHEPLRRIAYSIVDCFNNDPPQIDEGHKVWREVTDSYERLCVWKVLQPHSKIRAKLKEMDKQLSEGKR